MRILLSYLSAFSVVCYAAVSDTTPKYANGCVYIERQDEILSRYDPEHLNAPFVNCSYLGLTSVDFTDFNDSIVSLGLSRNELTAFNATNIARFSHLHFLDLGHNKISTVSAGNINDSHPLGNVYLGSNMLQEIPTALFKSFKRLSSLNLFNNKITSIKDNDFADASSLMSLTLAKNPITQISDTALLGLTRMLTLDLSDCGLTAVPTYTKNMKGMFSLNLGHNNITSVPENSFTNNTFLRLLSLSSNKINTIHPSAFEGAVKLSFIALSDNKISTLPEGLFNNMADEHAGMFVEMYENPIRCDCQLQWLKQWLDSLDVREEFDFTCAQPARNRNKHFHTISSSDLTCEADDKDWNEADQCKKEPTLRDNSDDNTLLCPKNCECYHSNGTKYQSVDRPKRRRWWHYHTFPFVDCMDAGLTDLPSDIRTDVKSLRLIGNKIDSLNIKWLEQFPSLSYLEIEGCGLKNFVASPQTVLPKLYRLDIQNNKLQNITKEHLSSFPNLTVLSINNNKLTNIPNDMFSNTRKLSALFIGPNPIKAFDGSCVDGLQLSSLSLSNMNLTAVPNITSPKLHYLDLNDNAITAIPNNTFSGTPGLSRLMLAHNKISSMAVDAFKGCTKLTYIDLVENKIGTLPVGIFDDMNRDRLTIQLWLNRLVCDCNMKWFKKWIVQLNMDDPQTDVRFSCFKPWRVHSKSADSMGVEDFVCKPGDNDPRRSSNDKSHCYTGGQIALAVLLTMLFTVLSAFLIRLFCRYRDSKNRYQRTSDTAPLDLDM